VLHAIVRPADIQDRDGGILVIATLFDMYPFLKKLFADGGYKGPQFKIGLARVRKGLKAMSSSVPIKPRALKSYQNVGLLNAASHGSIAAADWPRIGRTSIARRLRLVHPPHASKTMQSFKSLRTDSKAW